MNHKFFIFAQSSIGVPRQGFLADGLRSYSLLPQKQEPDPVNTGVGK